METIDEEFTVYHLPAGRSWDRLYKNVVIKLMMISESIDQSH